MPEEEKAKKAKEKAPAHEKAEKVEKAEKELVTEKVEKELVTENAAMPENAEKMGTVISDVPIQMNLDESVIKKSREEVVDAGPYQEKKKFFYTKKVCKFCTKQLDVKLLLYKNVDLLRRFVMSSGKILPRRISGNCAKHQRMAVREVKKARIIALLPYLDR